MPRKRKTLANPFVTLQMFVAKLERIRPGKDAETVRKAILKLDAAMTKSDAASRFWITELLRPHMITSLPEIEGDEHDRLVDVINGDFLQISDEDLRRLCFKAAGARYLLRCSPARMNRAILVLAVASSIGKGATEDRFRDASADLIMHLLINETETR